MMATIHLSRFALNAPGVTRRREPTKEESFACDGTCRTSSFRRRQLNEPCTSRKRSSRLYGPENACLRGAVVRFRSAGGQTDVRGQKQLAAAYFAGNPFVRLAGPTPPRTIP